MQNTPKFSLWCWSYTLPARLRSWSVTWLLWVVESRFWILKSYFNIFGCKLYLCCTSLQWSQYKHLSNVRKKATCSMAHFVFFEQWHTRILAFLLPLFMWLLLTRFCQSAVVLQWKGKNLPTAFLSPCHDSSIAIFLSSLFPDQKACVTYEVLHGHLRVRWMNESSQFLQKANKLSLC